MIKKCCTLSLLLIVNTLLQVKSYGIKIKSRMPFCEKFKEYKGAQINMSYSYFPERDGRLSDKFELKKNENYAIIFKFIKHGILQKLKFVNFSSIYSLIVYFFFFRSFYLDLLKTFFYKKKFTIILKKKRHTFLKSSLYNVDFGYGIIREKEVTSLFIPYDRNRDNIEEGQELECSICLTNEDTEGKKMYGHYYPKNDKEKVTWIMTHFVHKTCLEGWWDAMSKYNRCPSCIQTVASLPGNIRKENRHYLYYTDYFYISFQQLHFAYEYNIARNKLLSIFFKFSLQPTLKLILDLMFCSDYRIKTLAGQGEKAIKNNQAFNIKKIFNSPSFLNFEMFVDLAVSFVIIAKDKFGIAVEFSFAPLYYKTSNLKKYFQDMELKKIFAKLIRGDNNNNNNVENVKEKSIDFDFKIIVFVK